MSTIYGFDSDNFFDSGIITDSIISEDSTTDIELGNNIINFDSLLLQHNGIVIPSGSSSVSNPLISNLNGGAYSLVNVNSIEVNRVRPNGSNDSEIIMNPNLISLNNNGSIGNIQLNCGFASGTTEITGFSTAVNTTNFTNNGSIVLTTNNGVSKTMNSNLNAANFNINSVNSLRVNSIFDNIDALTSISMDASSIGLNTTTLNLNSTTINSNSRISQLVDIHNNNNTFAGTGSEVGTQFCTSFGNLAGSNTSLNYNSAFGYMAYTAGTILGTFNSAFGALCMQLCSSGVRNTGMGSQSLFSLTTGSRNIAIGFSSGFGIVGGNDNISIGHQANDSTADNGACISCIAIGNQTRTNANSSNTIVIGQGVVSTISNETIIGNSSCTILRNSGNGICDLGTINSKFKDLNIVSINSLTASGGKTIMTTAGTTLISSIVETNILSGSFIGDLILTPVLMPISCYRLNMAGLVGALNLATLTIRAKMNGNTILTKTITFTNISNEFFESWLDFTIRVTGGAGIAKIYSNFTFRYSDVLVCKSIQNQNLEQTLFNTNINQTLSITAQWGASSASNTIQYQTCNLIRVY